MKELVCILFSLSTFAGFLSCSSQNPDQITRTDSTIQEETASYQKLSPEAFEQKCSELPDEQLIDVRTPQEYEGGHLSSATLIDFTGEHFDQEVLHLDKKKPVMVYCQKGGRSSAAAARLQSLGFKEVYELDGGLTSWTSAGKSLPDE